MNHFVATVEGRLDKILAMHLDASRNQLEKLVKEGLVSVNAQVVIKSSFRVQEGDTVSYVFKEAEKKVAPKIDFDIEILYEDDHLLVINKPSGLVVHPAPSVKEPTLVDWLVHKGISLSTLSGEERHGIVHRIDKETTGALVIAKDNETHEALSAQLQDKSMGRYYLALIDHPMREDTQVDKPIGRNPKNRLMMDVVQDGRTAKTAFVKLALGMWDTELIAAKLYTGRTHQIRVHLKSLGRHILGDDLYGFKSKRDKIPRVYLHAYLLYLTHPITGKKMEFVAPVFEDMKQFLSKYFAMDEVNEKINPKTLGSLFIQE
ncbi:MAG TPA: RluA family pseudouridine synthase [Sulfurovum sp.]|jgi:23S rRNA pseudouridine1911/1915/1917 synthase|nr:MAG: pseudouridine synthase [Sulfurovum sp. 35-42-20]OYZ26075.1 MAG: pseudouridine synthase [Sulfurovum sp. 16-42-52]OYZ50463.1 MAG: pseudouridine synthase [Sulfurovum sp. 24-42-9]OZA60336.1 MAG: pseudouridine synthase [Sulfurovum sp. 39-42-12]HQR73359.1 RluA family pseudouridine synthase [Sulfurovum sp.]